MTALTLAFISWGDTLHVLGSPDGTATHLRPIGTFTPDWAEVDVACATIETLVRHAADCGEFSVASVDELRRASSWLFDELFPDAARRWLREREGTLTLSLDPALLHIPWELTHTATEFICTRWAIGRVVQHDVDPALARPAALDRPLSVLVVADPDDRLPEAYNEGLALRDQLSGRSQVDVSLRTSDVDAAYIRRRAREVDVLHYAGHIDDAGWRMSESRFDAAQIGRMTGAASMPAMVFANGCGATAATDWDGSMLRAWLRSGVRHVVGPLYDVPDRLGRAFAIACYESLLAGTSAGEAVRAARVLVADRVGEGTVPWGAYVVYGDPAWVYCPSAAASALVPARSAPLRVPTRLAAGAPQPELVRSGSASDVPVHAPRRVDPHAALFFAVVVAAIGLAIALVAGFSGTLDGSEDLPILRSE